MIFLLRLPSNKKYQTKLYLRILKYRVLMFPPLESKYRWLAHKFVEEEYFQHVCTFSIGKDDVRRLIVAKISIVMRYSSPFTCVHEKLQFVNSDQNPLTCNCASYLKTPVHQNINLSSLQLYQEVGPILDTASNIDIQDKPYMEESDCIMNISCKKLDGNKTKCKSKRIDKPLYVPPAQRFQKNNTSVCEASRCLESIEKLSRSRTNDKQCKGHLNIHELKNPTVAVGSGHIFKNAKNDFINEKEDTLCTVVPNVGINIIQNQLNVDLNVIKKNEDSKKISTYKETTDIRCDGENVLSNQNCHLHNCNKSALSENTEFSKVFSMFTEKSDCNDKLTSSSCYDNLVLCSVESDSQKFDFSSSVKGNSNDLPECSKKVIMPFSMKPCSLSSVCSDPEKDLNIDSIKELRSVIGSAEIHSAQKDYTEFKVPEICEEEFPDVIEIYGFPVELKTKDLLSAFSNFKSENFIIKWVDDCHALGIFSSPLLAMQALELKHPFIKVRLLAEGLRESKLVAKRHAKKYEAFKSRPPTSAALAKRLVTGALGLKLNIPKEEKEKEKQKIKAAKNRRMKTSGDH